MRFKLRSNLIDPQSTELLRISEKEHVHKENNASDDILDKKESENDKDNVIPTSENETKNNVITIKDIDKQEESLIRSFYDGRRKKRNFTKIHGKSINDDFILIHFSYTIDRKLYNVTFPLYLSRGCWKGG